MKTATVIGKAAPADGREWDCQCARCGSTLDFEECENCGGDGVTGHDCGEDCCCCLDPEDNIPCDCCGGRGSYPRCFSSWEFCESNPRPGREKTPRHTVEWFCLEG